MALAYEVQSLDGLPEDVKKEYKQVGDVYRLDVSGIDTGDELKEALRKEREDHKKTKEDARAKEEQAERDAQAAEVKRLEDAGEHQKALELLQKQNSEFKAKEEAARKDAAKSSVQSTSLTMANSMGPLDENAAELLAMAIRSEIEVGQDGVVIGTAGRSIDDVIKAMKESGKYNALLSGGKGSGSGAGGGKGGMPDKKPEDYTEKERLDLFRSNPEKFRELFPKK